MTALEEIVRRGLSTKYENMSPIELLIYRNWSLYNDELTTEAAEAFASLTQECDAIKELARFIVLNKRNFTIGDIDGIASATIDKLARLLDGGK